MNHQSTLLGMVVILFLGMTACRTQLSEPLQRTYRFSVMSQHSSVQFLFNSSQSYGALSNITLPSWQGCDGQFKRGAFTECTRMALEQYINEEFQIPSPALDSVIEGKVKYQFVLNENGAIENGRIIKNPGSGLGEEMERTILSLTELEPARINAGDSVASEITLEVYCDIVLR